MIQFRVLQRYHLRWNRISSRHVYRLSGAAPALSPRFLSTAMATPVASSSAPAETPALQGPHAGQEKPKGKDKKAKDVATTAHPLEASR